MIRNLLLATAAVAVATSATAARRAAQGERRRDLVGLQSVREAEHPSARYAGFLEDPGRDYLPALLAGMAEQKREVMAIANNPAAPNFTNTLVALERSGALLERANLAFSAVNGANTNDTLQATDTKTSPLFAAHYDFIFLNAKLFKRVKYPPRHAGVARPQPRAGQAARRLLQAIRPCRGRAAGGQADRSSRPSTSASARLQTQFGQKLLAAAKAGALHFADAAPLAGLSEQQLAAAQEAAKDRKVGGYVVQLITPPSSPRSPR